MIAITGDMTDGYPEEEESAPFQKLLDGIENAEPYVSVSHAGRPRWVS